MPREISTPRPDFESARIALPIEWTRRPPSAAVAQSAHNKLNNACVHRVDLYTGPLKWQISDQVGLASTIDLLTRVLRTATAVFLDGDEYSADPASPDHHAA